ncbi:MAG: lanthionine synthetase LanC family protein [Gemmatimonadaceae bacterium]
MQTDRMCNADSHSLTRRDAIKASLASVAAFAGLPSGFRPLTFLGEGNYLEAATHARAWLSATAQRGPNGLTWAADPLNPKSESFDLYNGMPGVVLFSLEYAHATGDRQALDDAATAAGRVYTAATGTTEQSENMGLYTGVAGQTYVLHEVYRSTGDRKFLEAVQWPLKMLKAYAKPTASGVQWSTTVDIISGNAGTGLTLLYLADQLHDDELVDIAHRAAKHVATLGIEEKGGLKWAMNPTFARRMPNFSHGTAGVAYFLAAVAERTNDAQLLDTAARGAAYLRNVATRTENNGWKVFHSEPGNESLYYLSWCHGPAGTARLYERLGRSARYKALREEVPKLAQGIVDGGVPEQSPGYWNNISQCCGNCGVVEFFTSLYRTTRDAKHLAIARKVMDNALGRATADRDGLKWVQAENRVSPNVVIAQTGMMQGAAGVGLALLHLDGAMKGRADRIVLPDNPWPGGSTT